MNPPGTSLKITFEQAAADLESRIRNLDYLNLPISDYSKRYFGDYLRKLHYALTACAFVINKAVEKTGKSPGEIVFVDNGGGIGMLSFLAKHAGIGTVIYHDIYEVAAKDAEIIARALGINIDNFVVGDTQDLINHIQKNPAFNVDIVASRNVIEHIYNLEEYFSQIKNISKNDLVLCLATTANLHNPLVDIYTKRIHRKAEFIEKKLQWGQKERDQVQPYLKLREKIISEYSSDLKKEIIDILAVRTRGLIKADIIKEIEKYKLSGNLPQKPSHPTNTCDPYTGNWAEHLVEVKDYKTLFEKNGFTFELIPGFYNTSNKMQVLNFVTPVVNFIMKTIKPSGIYLAPFIILSGIKRK